MSTAKHSTCWNTVARNTATKAPHSRARRVPRKYRPTWELGKHLAQSKWVTGSYDIYNLNSVGWVDRYNKIVLGIGVACRSRPIKNRNIGLLLRITPLLKWQHKTVKIYILQHAIMIFKGSIGEGKTLKIRTCLIKKDSKTFMTVHFGSILWNSLRVCYARRLWASRVATPSYLTGLAGSFVVSMASVQLVQTECAGMAMGS